MQRLLQGTYHRLGAWYLPVVLGCGWLLAIVLALVGYYLLGRYLDASGSEFGHVLAVVALTMLAGLAAGLVVSLDIFAPLQRWADGAKSAEVASEILPLAQDAGFSYVGRAALTVGFVNTPVLVYAGHVFDGGWGVAPAAVVLGWGAVASGWVIEMFVADLLVKPVVRDVAAELPEVATARPAKRHLRAKVLVTVPTAAFYSAYLTGSFIIDASSPEERLYTVAAATAAITLVFTGPVILLATGSILEPLRDLIAATKRVARGDLAVPVPVLATDEFGSLASNFNQMQRGLRERAALHAAISSYIDPTIAERVVAEGSRIPGEAAEVTIMFVDIVGFTSRAERAAPEDVVSDLNAFFDLVIPVVEREGGHANKLLGDGLMAVFGVPRAQPDHATRALTAALEISQSITERYGGALRAGIGLNSGTVVAGSMGGGEKLDYTIIGDAVNVAARVEALTRRTGDAILITESTRSLVATDAGRFVSRGRHELRGRRAEIELFTPPAAEVPRP